MKKYLFLAPFFLLSGFCFASSGNQNTVVKTDRETYSQGLSGEVGMFSNRNERDEKVWFKGAGFRFRQRLFGRLSAEIGSAVYTIVNYNAYGDVFAVWSGSGTLNIGVLSWDNFEGSVYGGVRKNFSTMLSNSQNQQRIFNATMPSIGGSLEYHLSNHWVARVNLGTDALTAGGSVVF